MEFYIGQTFAGMYPPEAAEWCNKNNAHIEKVDGVRTIVENPAPPEPTPEEIVRGYENAVQAHLDATAQSRDYDNTYTCLSYLSSTDEIWRRESNAFNAWRDQVWRKCHEILNAVMAGQTAAPTVEELIAQLPVIDWNDPTTKGE
jgi:hypothetical protein